MPREIGPFPPDVAHLILRLRPEDRGNILEALQQLCDDPHLIALREEEDQQFIVTAGYVVSVEIDEETVTVIDLYKLGAN